AFPPARGLTRTLDYVDFVALRSVHGLVVQPKSQALDVSISSPDAVISTTGGLTVSAIDALRNIGAEAQEAARAGYLDLVSLEERDPKVFIEQRDHLEAAAAASEARERDIARLRLAQYLVANRLAIEALGVLRVLEGDLKATDLTREIRSTAAI